MKPMKLTADTVSADPLHYDHIIGRELESLVSYAEQIVTADVI